MEYHGKDQYADLLKTIYPRLLKPVQRLGDKPADSCPSKDQSILYEPTVLQQLGLDKGILHKMPLIAQRWKHMDLQKIASRKTRFRQIVDIAMGTWNVSEHYINQQTVDPIFARELLPKGREYNYAGET